MNAATMQWPIETRNEKLDFDAELKWDWVDLPEWMWCSQFGCTNRTDTATLWCGTTGMSPSSKCHWSCTLWNSSYRPYSKCRECSRMASKFPSCTRNHTHNRQSYREGTANKKFDKKSMHTILRTLIDRWTYDNNEQSERAQEYMMHNHHRIHQTKLNEIDMLTGNVAQSFHKHLHIPFNDIIWIRIVRCMHVASIVVIMAMFGFSDNLMVDWCCCRTQ